MTNKKQDGQSGNLNGYEPPFVVGIVTLDDELESINEEMRDPNITEERRSQLDRREYWLMCEKYGYME